MMAVAPCTAHDVVSSGVSKYLFSYLSAIGATTIVCEKKYVDADYLDDYANFYAKSFELIPKMCHRLHFFRVTLKDAPEFLAYVLNERPSEELQENYLGFVVARPLSTAAIGRTVLSTYPSDGGRRNYPTTRRYAVNMFGMNLYVDSLAFQVQDTSLAACATVALWSCFQKTQDIFRSSAPTPVAITRAANRFAFSARPFPSRGLQVQQICNAIASAGLDPEVYWVNAALPLSTLVYSYLRLGLPVIAVVNIPDTGKHAITLTGYSLRVTQQLASEGEEVGTVFPSLVGKRIDEFYGHDDQGGPFVRLKLEAPNGPEEVIKFKGTHWGKDLTPESIIVPVYPKIRTGFRDVIKFLPALSMIAGWVADAKDFEWDVFLISSNDLKTSLRSDKQYDTHPLKQKLLLKGLPKYLWRCTLRVLTEPFLEVILDTTAMVSGFPIIQLWWCGEKSREALEPQVKAFEGILTNGLGPRFVDCLKDSLEPPSGS
jgi:hypothetical protein